MSTVTEPLALRIERSYLKCFERKEAARSDTERLIPFASGAGLTWMFSDLSVIAN